MIKLTISQAMIKLAEIEKMYKTKLGEIASSSSTTVSYILEADGTRHDCAEKFDFYKEKDAIMELSKQIELIRNEISKANNSTFVEVDGEKYTIQECLNKLKLYRGEMSVFQSILLYSRASKTRKVDAAGTPAYYKVTELTFDKEELQEYVDTLHETILKFELAVNEVNNNTVITVA